jgi:hypothetical protein
MKKKGIGPFVRDFLQQMQFDFVCAGDHPSGFFRKVVEEI